MSFFANSGRIVVTDADGLTKLDTDDGLFHVVGSPITGTQSIAGISLTNSNTINDTNTWNLGAVHPACTHLIGAVKFSGSEGGAVGFDRWTTYMGGTLIWILSAPPKISAGGYGTRLSDYMAYRFYCSGGQAVLEQRRILLGAPTNNFAIYPAHSLQYRLKAGLFT